MRKEKTCQEFDVLRWLTFSDAWNVGNLWWPQNTDPLISFVTVAKCTKIFWICRCSEEQPVSKGASPSTVSDKVGCAVDGVGGRVTGRLGRPEFGASLLSGAKRIIRQPLCDFSATLDPQIHCLLPPQTLPTTNHGCLFTFVLFFFFFFFFWCPWSTFHNLHVPPRI